MTDVTQTEPMVGAPFTHVAWDENLVLALLVLVGVPLAMPPLLPVLASRVTGVPGRSPPPGRW